MKRRPLLLSVALLAVVLVLFLGPALFGGRVLLPADIPFAVDPLWRTLAPEGFTVPANPILADQMNMYYAWQVYARRMLPTDAIPLWNPYNNGGQPYLGNGQAGLFGPFDLLRRLLPLPASYAWLALLRLSIAGVFMLLYGRAIGLRAAGATLSMLVFTLSGPMVVWLGYPLSSVMVWLPAMLYTGERLLATQSRVWLAACALAVGLQLLGGHPETMFHVSAAWMLYLVLRVGMQPPEQRNVKKLIPVLLAALLGVLLACIHLLPFVDALPESVALAGRLETANLAEMSWIRRLLFDSHEWPSAITLLLPRFFGSEADNSYWYPNHNSVEQNAYAGVLPLALAVTMAVYALRERTTPNRRLLLLWTLIGVGSLAVGLRLPLTNAVNFLPVLNVTAPGRLRIIFVLAVAVLAGAGLDQWLSGSVRFRQWVSRLLLLFALVGIGSAATAYAGFTLFADRFIESGRAFVEANWGTPYFTQPIEVYYDLVMQRQVAKLALYHPLHTPVMYLPVLIALAWMLAQRRATAYAAHAAILLVAIDLFWVGYGFNPAVDPTFLERKPALIERINADAEPHRVLATATILNPNSSMRYALADVRGYDPMAINRYVELLAGLPGFHPIHFHLYFTAADSPLFDLLNVKYLLTEQPQPAQRWEAIDQDGSVLLYRNRDVWPRAFLVYQAVSVGSAEESLARLHDPDFDFRRQVILESAPPDWAEPAQPPATPAPVAITAYTPDRVQMQVDTPVTGLLVFTDTYLRGWQAWIDDRPAAIWVANHAFRAVVVPGGSHTVTFAYRPRSFVFGVIASSAAGLTLLLLAVWGFVPNLRRKRTP